MKISIRDRLKAFSHTPGEEILVPGTFVRLKVFPTLLECEDLSNHQKVHFSWNLKGPIFPFTIEQDLEKSCVYIYGESLEGYFRFLIQEEGSKIILNVEKSPDGELLLEDRIVLLKDVISKEKPVEKLFLGSSKQKEFDLMRKRKNLAELLPFWFFLGGMTPSLAEKKGVVGNLLTACNQKIGEKDKQVADLILSLYLAGFNKGFVPRSKDLEFQGILPSEESNGTAFFLLTEGAFMIRSLFFAEQDEKCFFLPCLPSQFAAGKMIDIQTLNGCSIDIEWTKHQIRRICIRAKKDAELLPSFPFGIKRYRIRKNLKEKGKLLQKGESFSLKAGDVLWLDRFQT